LKEKSLARKSVKIAPIGGYESRPARIFEERASKIQKNGETGHFAAIQYPLALAHCTNYD
jgi:hypothetical protein